jgi:membrane dipeptidase
MMDEAFYQDSIVIDAVCPLLHKPELTSWYKQGGVTACAPTIATSGAAGEALRTIGSWLRRVKTDPDLRLIRSADDILIAKRDAKLGIILHFQGTDPLEDDPDLVDAFAAAGIRMIQLTYNVKNRVGDGCAERTDSGLSIFGLRLIRRFNENGIVVDCSHTGRRTTLDAIEASSAPVVFSHANPLAVVDSPRNITDEQIKAIAKTGGLIGANGFPPFVAKSATPTMDQFIDHMAYVADLVGIDHVGLGIDYYHGVHPVSSDEEAAKLYASHLDEGRWNAETYPPPPWHMPSGMATPRDLKNLCGRMLERGFSKEDTRKALGENWLRVFRTVWSGSSNSPVL